MIATWTIPALLAVPVTFWVVSYLVLAREFRTRNLLQVRIHESGRYTLAETVLYYSHFLRELPLDTLFAWAVLWTYSAAGIKLRGSLPDAGFLRFAPGVFLAFVFGGSLLSVGLKSSLADLFQFRETDTRVGWGSHWQMHFLSTAVLLLLLVFPGMVLAKASASSNQLLMILAVFSGLSLVFRCGYRSITDTRWVLHGAREAFTYSVLVAVPAFLPLLNLPAHAGIRLTAATGSALALLVGAGLYFLYIYGKHDLNEQASSTRGLVYLLSSHFFEHVLDFIYILLLILAAAAW